ncbi:NUDT23 [Scenedesmus sp. PABB004]|nr:NUDT23 [Scenedesmus sp. PABB004]
MALLRARALCAQAGAACLRSPLAAPRPQQRQQQARALAAGCAPPPRAPQQQRQQQARALADGDGPPSPAAPEAEPPAPPPHGLLPRQSKFCRLCGAPMAVVQPAGDASWRHVCTACSYVDYFNPKLVVGCIVEHGGKILLCKRCGNNNNKTPPRATLGAAPRRTRARRRAPPRRRRRSGIEPCRGLWTLPAGFLEIGESSAAGAARETLEEANAAVEVLRPYSHLDIPAIGQAYLLFKARLAPPFSFSPGPESLDVGLFSPDAIPFDEIAFSSVAITLRQYVEDMASGSWHMHHGVIHKRPGSLPNDPATYELRDHFAVPVGGQ